ncbi:MOSC domain-containing protein [Modestobacter sp. Leaf380]|uniref:MOSC domain-containing protein n=1 Tax=Modestobacter sp. Leaf380 TaxID=1736356 RepID=UPI001F28A54A|nr:MOSC domain-containing protein [Modestobacter sp. Leaf380]
MTVVGLYVTPHAAAPMQAVDQVQALPGLGLAGDRYALGGGTWADWPDAEKQLTLIDVDAVAEVADLVGAPFTPADTRRNVATRGVDLPALVGRFFLVGDVLAFGMKRCPPCRHLATLTGLPLVKPMALRGGINAALFTTGTIAVGAPVRQVEDAEAATLGAPAVRPVPRVVGA